MSSLPVHQHALLGVTRRGSGGMVILALSKLRPENLRVDEIVLFSIRLRDDDLGPMVGVIRLILELP